MTPTLEQELAAVIAGSDYRVKLWAGVYLHVTVYYIGASHPLQIGDKSFGGWRRWTRAKRYVEKTIQGHRGLLAAGVRHP